MECTGTRFRKDGFEFPCGQCMVCRLRTQRTWTGRILLEQAVHNVACFVTLTYAEEPRAYTYRGVDYPAGSVSVRDCQLWLKKLRREVDVPIRYVLVGEYGEDKWRPHYHAALFGCEDSALILKTWGNGHILVKGLGPESAAYIVSYMLKRRNNGERCGGRYPEFKLQSLRPAIGLRTSQRLLLPSGREVQGVRIGGRVLPLGRYLRSQIRTREGPEAEASIAMRHRIAKFSLQVRDPADHQRRVENAKTFTEQVKRRRREKQGLQSTIIERPPGLAPAVRYYAGDPAKVVGRGQQGPSDPATAEQGVSGSIITPCRHAALKDA